MSMIIVACEECGKNYRVDLTKIRGNSGKFSCLACNHVITVSKPSPQVAPDSGGFYPPKPSPEVKTSLGNETKTAANTAKIKGIGIKGKMIVLFILVPVLLMLGASLFYISQMRELSGLITDDSTKMVTQMAEQIILEKGLAVAREAKLYLDTHPDLKKDDFNKNPEFKNVAMQKVGKTGYTLLVERRTKEQPIEIMWVHPVDKLVGVDLEVALKKKLGDKWARWAKIRSSDHITKGYYLWFDNREKYCANIPIPGSPFNIVSSTYIDEFYKPVEDLQLRAESVTNNATYTVIFILAIAALLVAAIAFFYGNSLSSKIRTLTDMADRISIGELDADLTVKSNDEIGALAEAINRMQDSIRISIERLRRRGR
jgi:predicted Zn finger-like uncharacterized protein